MRETPLLPTAPFWIVRLGAGYKHYGPFPTEKPPETVPQ